jgi:hypothetical protein
LAWSSALRTSTWFTSETMSNDGMTKVYNIDSPDERRRSTG